MAKDINRYSYSRLSTFKQCPRKHHYIYVEQIEQPEVNIYTTSGKLFHQCIEYTLKNQDIKPILQEFEKLCRTGELELEPDLLEYVVTKYLQYYNKDYSMQQTLLVEYEFQEKLEDDDYIVGAIDQAFASGGYFYIRDMKTTLNNLKYTQDDVRNNSQMLLYVPFAEAELNVKINAIQIDEVRLAKLQPVPRRANGKPSTDKKLLSLVTYEDYFDALAEQGLETEKEYIPVLDYLKQRGHPLFNRVTVQLLNENVISTNAQDILDTYHAAKQDWTFKVHGPLCKYCAYQELCELDATVPDTPSREVIINKIKNN